MINYLLHINLRIIINILKDKNLLSYLYIIIFYIIHQEYHHNNYFHYIKKFIEKNIVLCYNKDMVLNNNKEFMEIFKSTLLFNY